MIRRIALPTAVAVVLVAACGTPPGGERVDTIQAALTGETVSAIGSSSLSCRVSNQFFGGTNAFGCGDDMAGADLGIPVYDGVNTWILFGDALTTDQNKSVRASWGPTADPVGYFAGSTPSSVCGGLSLVTIAGDSQTVACTGVTGGVFAPDVVVAPTGTPVGDFVFQGSVVRPPTSGGALPANAAIPGTDEVPSGAFAWEGALYTFYTGAPQDSSVFGGLPSPSVSYLTQWTPTTSVSQPFAAASSRQIVSMVDYSLDNAIENGPPTAPPGWSTTPPLGGNFVQVSPVPSGEYLYLFGTGPYRFSQIYLARLPMTALESTLPPSLVQVSGFQVWTGSAWSSTVSAAAPIVTDASADVGELSVQSYSQGIWLMMYAPRASGHVIVRWSNSVTGPWSAETTVLDTTTAANQETYCCSGAENGTDPDGNPLWECSGQQLVECATQTDGGAPRSNPYAPYLFPFLSAITAYEYQVSYMVSSFEPYGTSLMTFDIDLENASGTCPAQACGTDQVWSTSACACECRCGEIIVTGHDLCRPCDP